MTPKARRDKLLASTHYRDGDDAGVQALNKSLRENLEGLFRAEDTIERSTYDLTRAREHIKTLQASLKELRK